MNTQFLKDDIQSAIDKLTRAQGLVDSDPKRCTQNLLIVAAIVESIKEELSSLKTA